jgi:ABC-type multidrug transport system fused ATPase/permease subunit
MAQQDFKISFSVDLNPFVAGLKTMLNLVQESGKQIQPLLNMQVAKPDFGPFEQQIIALQKEVEGMVIAQVKASTDAAQMGGAEQGAAADTGKLGEEEKKTKVSTDMMSDSFQKAFFAISTIHQVFSILKYTFGGLIESANQQERAETAYARALENRGLLTNNSIADARTFAGELQKLTGIQDEQTIETMAQLTAMGLQGDQLKEATKLAGDLSVVMGTNMRTAARVMADAFNGNTGMLGRYIKGLDEADIKQRGAISIIEQVKTAVGGQAEAFGTVGAGKLQVFGATVDDVKKTLGGLLRDAILPFLGLAKGVLDWFTQAPKPIQTLIGGAALLTITLVALRITGLGELIKTGFVFATTTLPKMIAGLTATTTAAWTTAGAMGVLQAAIFPIIGIITTIAAFIGIQTWLKNQEEQMKKNADAARAARDAYEAYKESVKDVPTSTTKEYQKKLENEINSRKELIRLKAIEVNPSLIIYPAQLKVQTDLVELTDQYLQAKIRELKQTQELNKERDAEQSAHDKLLQSINKLIKANAELDDLKKKLTDPKLTDKELADTNRKIQAKQREIDELQKMGTIDYEEQKKLTGLKEQLTEEYDKFVLDNETKRQDKLLDLMKEEELAHEKTEIGKLAIEEKYAILKIDKQTDLTIKSIELEKKRLEAIGTPEAKIKIGVLTEKQEEIRRSAEEDKKVVRKETNVKVEELQIKAPIGSILAQQKEVEEATKRLNEATTDEARRAARKQLEIEKDKLDKMTMSNKEYFEKTRQRQEEEGKLWMESHRVAMAAVDGMTSGFKQMWAQFIIGNRQAKDGWDAVWLSMRNTALNALGDILTKEIENLIISNLMTTTTAEKKVGITTAKSAAEIGILTAQTAAETGIAIASITAMTAAVTTAMAAISAVAWTPATLVSIASWGGAAVIGEAAVLQALAVVKAASVVGLEKGGIIEKGEKGFFEGKGMEVVAPEKTFIEVMTQELIPKIITEGMPKYDFSHLKMPEIKLPDIKSMAERITERMTERQIATPNKTTIDTQRLEKEMKEMRKAVEKLRRVVFEQRGNDLFGVWDTVNKNHDRLKL